MLPTLGGWCAGRNPPFVSRRHSAERATRASHSTHRRLLALSPRRTAVSPLPPSLLGDLARHIVTDLVGVSFLFRSRGSRPTPCGVAGCAVGGVSSGRKWPESHPPAHQPKLSFYLSIG